ncbi:cytochrome c oxidase subunit II [Tumidithrix elongata RA019]|uniref:Cytochrome c oxidase subunit 2 n=1 Tax=Tumidithrix elongata BACA0141 TaxID=2716417 RepID=A0AAW9PWT8_9CYAN|nr:cytochrome c oxidase subunit II [Tumidithrix elongata RA019]
MKRKNIISVLILTALIVAASIWYGQNHGLLPLALGPEAALYDSLFGTLIGIAFGLFLIVQGVLIFSIFRFRQRKGDNTDGPAIHENLRLELIWTAIPTVMVMWIAIYSFDVYTTMQGTSAVNNPMAHNHQHQSTMVAMADPSNIGMNAERLPSSMATLAQTSETKAETTAALNASAVEPLAIDVSGMQFAWIFNYSDDIAVGELHIPVNRKIRLNLSAVDVIHAFWVPQLRLKQDAVPGLPTHIEFTADQVGEYPVVCAELCGSYHGGMRTTMVVHTPEEYDSWLKEQQEVASAPSDRTVASRALPTNTQQMTETEYLSGKSDVLAKKMGIDSEMLGHIHHTDSNI